MIERQWTVTFCLCFPSC